ncbi:MAG: hypothetical protein ACKORL_11620, partial [Phycisphaerales bacterium]
MRTPDAGANAGVGRSASWASVGRCRSCVPGPRAAGTLPTADLEWRDGIPWSRAFRDAHWSRHGARAEREHAFLRGQGFGAADDADAGRWGERRRWTIGELGFGGAVSFLCAWAAFRRHAATDAQLDWVSVELAPLAPEDLRRVALADTSMAPLAPLVDELCAALPPRVPGRRVTSK